MPGCVFAEPKNSPDWVVCGRLLSCRPLPLLSWHCLVREHVKLHFTSAVCCVKSSPHCDIPIIFALQVGSASQHAGGCKCSSVFLACTILTFILGRDVVLASVTIHCLKAASRNEHRALRPRVVACYDRRNCGDSCDVGRGTCDAFHVGSVALVQTMQDRRLPKKRGSVHLHVFNITSSI